MDDQHGIDCGCEEYNELSRRQFITASAGVSAAAFFPAWLPKIVMSNHYASNRDIIVSVFMRGGADGLSIAVPFADPNYYTSRSTIHCAPGPRTRRGPSAHSPVPAGRPTPTPSARRWSAR